MGLIKLIIKLLVLPLIVAVTLVQWVGIFFTQFSTVIFNLLAGLMFLKWYSAKNETGKLVHK